MRIERANLAAAFGLAIDKSIDVDRFIARESGKDVQTSIRTKQLWDALEAIENGEQLEIV